MNMIERFQRQFDTDNTIERSFRAETEKDRDDWLKNLKLSVTLL